MTKLYGNRNPMELDKAGKYYARHVSAMTVEGLHAKSDIAAELGWRDQQIDQLLRAPIFTLYRDDEVMCLHRSVEGAKTTAQGNLDSIRFHSLWSANYYPDCKGFTELLERMDETLQWETIPSINPNNITLRAPYLYFEAKRQNSPQLVQAYYKIVTATVFP